MSNKNFSTSSKFLSLILRHRPELIKLGLDKHGWANVEELLEKVQAYGKKIDIETLEQIVKNNEKKRFSFNEDKSRIRANQGHSIKVDLELTENMPPELLYHGTAEKNVPSILALGLQKRNRHHVHLSLDKETALEVGKRHGKPVVFEVLSGKMFQEGFQFFVSENSVWLTEEVPAQFLKLN